MIYLLCSANISDINSRSWQCVTTFHRVDQDLSVDRSDRLVGQTCVEFPVILISSFTVISGSITPLTRRIIFYPPWLALGSTHGHDWEEILWIHSIRTFHIQPAVKLLIFSWFEVASQPDCMMITGIGHYYYVVAGFSSSVVTDSPDRNLWVLMHLVCAVRSPFHPSTLITSATSLSFGGQPLPVAVVNHGKREAVIGIGIWRTPLALSRTRSAIHVALLQQFITNHSKEQKVENRARPWCARLETG